LRVYETNKEFIWRSQNVTAQVTIWEPVNRYGYQPVGLFLPYGLANILSFIVLVLAFISFNEADGIYPDKRLVALAGGVEDTGTAATFRDMEGMVTVQTKKKEDGTHLHLVWQRQHERTVLEDLPQEETREQPQSS
jgi:hypothetical protein